MKSQQLVKSKAKITHKNGDETDHAETTTKVSNNNEAEAATAVDISVTDALETFKCSECYQNLSSAFILEVHMKVFHETKCLSCELFDKEFEQYRQLITHINTCHSMYGYFIVNFI